MTFGEKVRELREDYEPRLSQRNLGILCGMSQQKISRIETNVRGYEPSLNDIKTLCDFFKVSADYLIGIPKGYRYPER